MSERKLGPREAQLRALREANHEKAEQKRRQDKAARLRDLKADVAEVAARKPKKKRRAKR